MGIVTTQRAVEEKARQIAARVFADGTMRTMLYELIVGAFGVQVPERAPVSAGSCHHCGYARDAHDNVTRRCPGQSDW